MTLNLVSYWIIGKGTLYLAEGVSYTTSLNRARKFESKESALEFAYDGRPIRGGTFVQEVSKRGLGVKSCPEMSEAMTQHLGKSASSVMDNTSLLKLSVKKFG